MENQEQPNSAEGFIERGISCTGKDDYGQAIADYTKAISIAPDEAFYYHKLSDAYWEKGIRNE